MNAAAASDSPGHEAGDGKSVIAANQNRVARFVRLYKGEALATGEMLLRYGKRSEVRPDAKSFFFEEGKASVYEQVRYGELKVTADGAAFLVNLRSEKLELVGGSVADIQWDKRVLISFE